MLCRSRGPIYFSIHAASQHQPDHFVVTHKRPQRILKGSRFVFLYEEVTNPGGAVTGDETERKQPPLAGDNEVSNATERDGGSEQVKQASLRLAVFGDIVWPELGERIVFSFSHQN